MKDRQKIIDFFKASGQEAEEIAIRLTDLAESTEKGRPFAVGPFMSPYAVQVASTIAAHMKTVSARAWGGYHEADRDVLGALMGLGVERDVLGDILMQGSGAQLIVDSRMTDWIQQNFVKVAMVPMKVEEIPFDELVLPEKKAKGIRATVASLRLDAVGAAGFGVSRSKMVSAISGDKVQVNWAPAKGTSQTVKPGDIISFRGRGRIEIVELTGKSRKGRTGVRINRYK